MARVITATDASKHFKDVLNAVQYGGETFEVERHGRPVAQIVPSAPRSRRMVTLREALEMVRRGPPPDEALEADLSELRTSAGTMPTDPWERWSTPRS